MAQVLLHRPVVEAEEGRPGSRMIPEVVLDLWDQHAVTTERVQRCKACEQEALAPAMQAGPPLQARIRSYALEFIKYVILNKRMHQHAWVQAVSLLDTYWLKVSGSIPMLPATCVCLVRLVQKFNNEMPVLIPDQTSTWLPFACEMAQGLGMLGFHCPEITETTLDSHELEICRAMNWKMDVTTVEWWISVFSTRFHLLTSNSVKENSEAMMFMARQLIKHEPASLQFSHRKLALGVFSIGLVMAGLMHVDILRPPAAIPSGGDAAFGQSEPTHETTPMANQMWIEALEATTCSEVHVLRQAAQSGIQTLAAVRQISSHLDGVAASGHRQVRRHYLI
eukprot:TRINITY_DN19367_c0_g1_i1.p1 TRINITY_DN19367_c0_g1~~TRINITY_DN19367_c0_g1_i1.p1  ORF type:complete len:353 (+),score=44.04 TRINITY_DN19367_c0_g1_i1:50-1060(+)